MINPELMKRIQRDIDHWEQPVLWMYLDSEGNVTVGSGIMLPDAASAKAVKFHNKKTFLAATLAEIESAWKKVHSGYKAQKAAKPKNKFASGHYKDVTDLRILQGTSDKLRDEFIKKDYLTLKHLYKNFDSFPENAKLALFDMIYNLGLGRKKTPAHRAKGLLQYVLMNAAINKQDWETAAKQCWRHGIPIKRNKFTADLFKSCIKPFNYKYNMLDVRYA